MGLGGLDVVRAADDAVGHLRDRAAPGLLATVAHDLRAPMSSLIAAAEVLHHDYTRLDDPARLAMVASIHRNSLWMREMMENLLCSAAIADGRMTIDPRPVDTRATIDEIRGLVEPLLAQKDQHLCVMAEAVLPLVAGDPHRISQVLLNLISNAHRYSDPGTTIDVSVRLVQGRVRVEVCDQGPGIPRSALRAIFNAYERAGRSDGGGLGIGLSIVRSIVEAHGGRFGASNRKTGGARLWFDLPVMVADECSELNSTKRVG